MTARILRRITAMSLRARVLVIATALLTVGQAAGSAVLIGALEHYLIGRTDSQLRQAARVASRTDADLWSSVPRDSPGSFLWGNFLAHLDPDGAVRRSARSGYQPGVSDPRLPRLDTATVAAWAGTAVEVPEVDGSGRWRITALPRDPEGSPNSGSVVVAASLHEVDATIAQLRTLSLLVGASLLVVLTVVGALALRAGLRPLRRVEETAAAIAAGDLSRRVPDLAAPHTEVGRLAAALNSMLVRNETAFAARASSEARMRRFVADEGPGLTDDQAQRVFDRFYRADGSRTRARGGGAGLGLSIVHALVSAHGGHVELRSAAGEGAAFRVLLPALTDCGQA